MRHFLSTMLGQIVAIIACSSAITFTLFVLLLFNRNGPPAPRWPWQSTYRIDGVVRMLENTPAGDRAHAALTMQLPGLALHLTEAPGRCATHTYNTDELRHTLDAELRDRDASVTVQSCSDRDPNRDIQVLVRTKTLDPLTLEVHTQHREPDPPRLSFPLLSALLFTCVGVAAMSAWAVARVIRPLRRLVDTTDAFGREITLAPIKEEGPLEIRRAAHAFNLMQERITRSLHNRTRMLATVSHDLRTPLTRMRLQIETSGSGALRGKLLRDIDLMQAVVSSALAFMRTGAEDESKEWLDLGALIATLCDEYEEGGASIHYEGPSQIRLLCQPYSIQRALTNLMDNALEHGRNVLVTASVSGRNLCIDVSDDGPGIPEEHLQDVVEPFVRLARARAGRPGGVGLGLAMVQHIVQAHGGKLVLLNRRPTGLTARILLPR